MMILTLDPHQCLIKLTLGDNYEYFGESWKHHSCQLNVLIAYDLGEWIETSFKQPQWNYSQMHNDLLI